MESLKELRSFVENMDMRRFVFMQTKTTQIILEAHLQRCITEAI